MARARPRDKIPQAQINAVVAMVDSGLSYEEISERTGYFAIRVKEAYEKRISELNEKDNKL